MQSCTTFFLSLNSHGAILLEHENWLSLLLMLLLLLPSILQTRQRVRERYSVSVCRGNSAWNLKESADGREEKKKNDEKENERFLCLTLTLTLALHVRDITLHLHHQPNASRFTIPSHRLSRQPLLLSLTSSTVVLLSKITSNSISLTLPTFAFALLLLHYCFP